jgi:hypothetical protein
MIRNIIDSSASIHKEVCRYGQWKYIPIPISMEFTGCPTITHPFFPIIFFRRNQIETLLRNSINWI